MKRTICLALSASLLSAAAFPLSAFAENAVYPDVSEAVESVGSYVMTSRGLNRTDAEWDALEDNTLLYDEIADLVHEYNATVISNRADLVNDERKSMDAADVSNWLVGEANDYFDDAYDIEDTSATLAAQYITSGNSLMREADENLDDYEIIKLEYEEAEDEIALSARSQFLAYYSSLAQTEYDRVYLEYLERTYTSTVNMFDNQMATELDVLTAREALEEAKSSAVSNEASVDDCFRNLIVSCGWKYDSTPEIGALPEEDPAELAAVDYEADKALALESSYTLRIDNIRLANAKDFNYSTLIEEQETQLRQDTDSFGISFRAAYDSLINAVNSYNNAVSSKASSDQNLTYAEQQYSLGTISSVDLLAAQYSNSAQQFALTSAYISMLSAKAVYDAAVNDGIL